MGEGGTMPDGTIRSVIGLTEADVIAANFAALGIQNNAVEATPERVFSAYVDFAKENKRLPTALEVSRIISLSVSSVRSACRALHEDGRMLKFRASSGQWAYMPKVTE